MFQQARHKWLLALKIGCLQSINQDLEHLQTILSPQWKKRTREDMSKKLSLIPIKLQKLDNIESRLNNLFTTVSSIDGKIAHLVMTYKCCRSGKLGRQTRR